MSKFKIQSFETELVGLPVGRLFYSGDDIYEEVLSWKKKGVWFVSCRVPEGVVVDGFREIETLVTFELDLTNHPLPAMSLGVVRATSRDHDVCVGIAKRAFVNDRLHQDPMFPDSLADKIRENWVRNDLEGRADTSFTIWNGNGNVVGFILCLEGPVIDLVAVNPEYQGKGFGRRLVAAVKSCYRGQTMRVGTQADNEASIRLYENAGFREVKRETTFHWINDEIEYFVPRVA